MYHDSQKEINKYICFHSREIRRHDKAFNDKLINHQNFLEDLTKTLKDIDCVIISINIDLIKYLKKGNFKSVYETAFDLLLERYITIMKNNKKGILVLEARGKSDDKLLLKHIYEITKNKDSKLKIKDKIKGIYFNPKWKEKYNSTYIGLEIADLFSYPIHQYVKYQKENPAFNTINSKIYGFPNFKNKGIVIYPK